MWKSRDGLKKIVYSYSNADGVEPLGYALRGTKETFPKLLEPLVADCSAMSAWGKSGDGGWTGYYPFSGHNLE